MKKKDLELITNDENQRTSSGKKLKAISMNNKVAVKLSPDGYIHLLEFYAKDHAMTLDDVNEITKMEKKEIQVPFCAFMALFSKTNNEELFQSMNLLIADGEQKNKEDFKEFNINSAVFVKLSDVGYQRLFEYFEELGVKDENEVIMRVRMDGRVIEVQMWELMEIFGPLMEKIMKQEDNSINPFQSTDMLVYKKDLKEQEKSNVPRLEDR